MKMHVLWLAGLGSLVVSQPQHHQPEVSVAYDTSPKAIDGTHWTVAVVPTVLHPESPLLNTTQAGPLQKRKKIKVDWAGVGVAFNIPISTNNGLGIWDNIAAKTDENSCSATWGTAFDNEQYLGYAYHATSTGKNCDTTSIYDTIKTAVRDCASKLQDARAVVGCCNFSHGGTWMGHLQLSSAPDTYPAVNAACPPF